MHGRRGKSLIEQEVIDIVNLLFAIHEDQGSGGLKAQKEVVKGLLLVEVLNPDNLRGRQEVSGLSSSAKIGITYHLLNVPDDTARAGDPNSNMIPAQVSPSQLPTLFVE